MPGWWLASGNQRRLTGSVSASDRDATMRYIYKYTINLLYFTADAPAGGLFEGIVVWRRTTACRIRTPRLRCRIRLRQRSLRQR